MISYKKQLFLCLTVFFLLMGSSLQGADSLNGKKIGIDPGHGGDKIGSPGWDGEGYPDEKDFNLDVGLKLKTQLQNNGAIVAMTRDTDVDVDIAVRVNYINNLNPDVFISIHCNGNEDPAIQGTETYWHTYGTVADRELATYVQNRLLEYLQRPDRGVKQGSYAILTGASHIPAVIAELLHITNQEEFNLINTASGQQNAASGMYHAIRDFLSIPSGRVTVDVDTKYWEDGLYQLRITAQAPPDDVSSITISGPHIDTATVQTGGGDPHHLYDDGKHHDGAANDGEWWVLLNIKESPVIGETITFDIKYNDGSSEIISKAIDGLVTETATLVSPPNGSTVDTLTPTFQWRNPSIPGLTYSVQIDDRSHNRVYEVYDLPDGTTSHIIERPLNSGATYYWLISASDPNGNEALTLWDAFRVSSLVGLGYDKTTQVVDTINQGVETIFSYIISQAKDLIFALGWEGSTLKLSVYKPGGSLYREEENSTSPITISVPKAETGEWRYKITGIDVPYDNYPFVVEIGERPPVASDLENLTVYPNPCRLTDGNPTITFKGLTADATIRILGIDGQLINETELIGQVNWTWNVKNQTNEDLTRGIYIYLITNSAGQKKIGKIAIIK